MKNLKIVLSVMLCACMVLGTSATSFASESSPVTGGTGQTTVELTAEPANLDVVLPTGLPVTVKSDGSIVVANDAKIINNSPAPVAITGVSVKSTDPWNLVSWTTDLSGEKINSRKFAFSLQGVGANADGSCAATFSPVPSGGNVGITYDAKVVAQSDVIVDAEMAKVVFTVGWDEAPKEYVLSAAPARLSSDGDDCWIDLKDPMGNSIPYSEWQDGVSLNRTDYMNLQSSDSGNTCYVVPLSCGVTTVSVDYNGWSGSVDVLTYDDGTVDVQLTCHPADNTPWYSRTSTATFDHYDKTTGILYYSLDSYLDFDGMSEIDETYLHRGDVVYLYLGGGDDGMMGNTDWFESCNTVPVSFSADDNDLKNQTFSLEPGEAAWYYEISETALSSRYILDTIPGGTLLGIRLQDR